VVCLLRGADRRAELIAHLTALELWREADADRLEVVTGDLAAPRLGLDPAPHTALAARVSWVVHAAAWVNHLYPYERLAPANAHSLAAVLEFAAAERPSAVSYLSTTAVFGSAAYPPGAEVGAGPLAALPPERDGYGRSKAVGETYAACAAELGLATTVIRLPNVFGDRTRFQVNRADAVWSWITAMLRTGAYPAGFDIAGDEMFQALPADVAARAVVHTARPGPGPGVRFVNAVPNLVCSSRGLVAGLRAAGHDLMPVPDTDWYRRVAELDPREVWVAALAGDLAERPAPGPNRLHRFRLDDDPAVAELVNAHAVWTPGDLARYVATLDAR
jgi:thioester reductase-like protein